MAQLMKPVASSAHAILHISQHPWTFVRSIEGYRSAQIVCRLLGERFPGEHFGVVEGFAFDTGLASPGYRDSAHSHEIERLVDAEIFAEVDVNSQQEPKWIGFRFGRSSESANFGYSAYLEHDVDVVAKCRADPDFLEEKPIYAHYPPPDGKDAFTSKSPPCDRAESLLLL